MSQYYQHLYSDPGRLIGAGSGTPKMMGLAIPYTPTGTEIRITFHGAYKCPTGAGHGVVIQARYADTADTSAPAWGAAVGSATGASAGPPVKRECGGTSQILQSWDTSFHIETLTAGDVYWVDLSLAAAHDTDEVHIDNVWVLIEDV